MRVLGFDSLGYVAFSYIWEEVKMEWKEIDSAPKDGSYFLAVKKEKKKMAAGLCRFENGKILVQRGEKFQVGEWVEWNPTHWREMIK